MKEINLIKADGTVFPLNNKRPLRVVNSAQVKEELMGEDTLTLEIESAEAIAFEVGDRVSALGKTYFLNAFPRVQRRSGRHFVYTAVFESAKYEMTKVVMVNDFAGGQETVNETEFSYTGEFRQLMDLIVRNMGRVYGPDRWAWREVDTGTDDAFTPHYEDCKTLTFSSENVLSALNTVCAEWNAEFRVEEVDGVQTIQVGRVGRNVSEYVFAYGRDKGLYTLTRDKNGESPLVTRLYAFGSTDNLGNAYRERRRRLALPLQHESPWIRQGLYVQDDELADRFGLSEGAVVFDDIYPCREGTVTAIDEGDELKFTDDAMFDLNEKDSEGDSKYWLGMANPVIRFNTGNLGGYEFSLAGYNSQTRTFTLIPFTDENEYRYPSRDDRAFRVAPGDKYVILNIALPDSYVVAAESRLAERALAKYREMYRKLYTYTLEIDHFFMKKYFPNAQYAPAFSAGDYVNVRDEALVDVESEGLGEHTTAVKIASVTVDLYHPYSYTLGLSDSAPSSVLSNIVKSEKETEKVIKINDLSDPARARRNLRTTAELLEMTFDTDGYFVDGRIRPETIETKMIAVGALSQQFLLDGVVFYPNWNGRADRIRFSGGNLTHVGLDKVENRVWSLLPGERSGLEDEKAYYVYARCEKNGRSGTMVVEEEVRRYDQDEVFYYFSVGVLHSVDEGFRRLSLTYGLSTINGREITTGRIESANGNAYFDLDSGEIGGRIVFTDDSVYRDKDGNDRTVISSGKIKTELIETDSVVTQWLHSDRARIADFEIHDKWLEGRGGHIVFQNAAIETLEDLTGDTTPEETVPGSSAQGEGTALNSMEESTLELSVAAEQEITVSHAGMLYFTLKAGRDDVWLGIPPGKASVESATGKIYRCIIFPQGGSETNALYDFTPTSIGAITDPAFFDQKAYIPQAGTYVIRFTLEDRMTVRWVDKPSEDWPEDRYPVLQVQATLEIAGQGGSGTIVFKGSEALTKIGTDGLYSFWSVLNYLYFSKDKGLRIAADTEISSPNGDYKLTINDAGISIKGDVGSDLSNSTVSFTVAGTRVNIATGEKLSVAFGKIARWFADLKTVAFTGSYNDLTNRPASLPANGGNADTVDGKHATDFIPATDKGSAGGVAELDTTGKVPAAQLPLGETSGTAYPGNKGKQNADDIAALKTGKLDKTGDASDTTVAFTPEAGDPLSGGKLRNIVGRIVKKISDIVSGAIAVGVAVNDSSGLHIANNYLRRSYVRPGIVWNSTGWRRIYIAGNADHPGGTVMLNITNLYSNTPPQLLSLLISTGSGGVVIQQFNASYNVPIGKVRVCRKSNTPWCVDVYCNDARANYIYANQCGGDGYIVGSEMADPSIEGYAVTEYEIKAGDRVANVSQLPKVYVQSAEPAGAPEGSLWAQNVD